ncbi:UDP-N-acetylmuramoylalanyl-D-glutamyl-2,6-diaminopimelate--D-alanyl-D-alanine ligase [Pseudovibrio flavus]|uniref:UDP-N-acetylmuramoylalanyl-D-glutamyl-2, 6-diaminopimelate--D-alanyl-D-alanine ligase n=1 Tax=Pseudovibrio flavus TaxID=2529854 RepID=UPI00211C5182|nr:UDP-N-acetylmuramoylalanyl-D-glutamyl-2,6-diaminopimelate--D-alanyl-D-alanine ligase [Pseudovibrio flavus]
MASAFEEIDKLLASGEIAHVSKAVEADEVVAEDVAQEAEAFEVTDEVEAEVEAEALEESVAVEEPVIDEEAKARSEQFAAAPIHTRVPASLPQARKVISKPLPRKAPELVNAHLAQVEPEGGDAALWTLHDFAVAIGGELMGQPGQLINGISIDSRSISEGDAFFAIKGDRMDGHDFVETALSGGAAIAVVAREKLADLPRRRAYLVVDDVLEALERLGIASRSRMNGRVIAVTGSVGKTGTKEALRLALSRSGKTHAPVASFNNHWGVPLTLARMPKDTDFGIFEIGMNHPGEITPLSRMVRPHVAIITTVEPVHLAAFDSVEQIAKAKAEIFAGLEPGGAAVLNRDNRQYDLLRYLASVAGVKDIVTFGRRAGCDAYVTKTATTADCTSLNAVVLGEEITYKIGAPGNHYVLNSLAVLLGVCKLGADLARAGLALADMRAPKGRGEQTVLSMRGGNAVLIDESYNANPASMRAAIAVLGEQTPLRNGRRIAVLGDMLELGENSDKFHADLARDLAQARIDTVYCVGTHMAHLWERLPETVRGAYAESSDELRETIVRAVRVNDIIMIKGSLGTKMGPLVETLKKHFPTEANSDPA